MLAVGAIGGIGRLGLIAAAVRQLFDPQREFFSNGEQGVWYDPSDFIRYTQPGPELINTLDFNATDWGKTNIASQTANSFVTVSSTGGVAKAVLVVGKTYTVAVSGSISGGEFSVNTSDALFDPSTRTQFLAGFGTVTFQADRSFLYLRNSTAGNTTTVLSVSVREHTALSTATLFQDSAGTTPVTAVEQPVGLMLDKRLGLVLGPELPVVFSAPSGYSNTVSSTGGVTSVVSVNPSQASRCGALILGSGAQGKSYRVTLRLVSSTGGGAVAAYLRAGTSLGLGTIFSNSQAMVPGNTYTFQGTSANSAINLMVANNTVGTSFSIDNISIRELPGNHAFQTTAIDRPVLRNRYNLLTKTERFDDAVWVKSQLTVTPNATVAPDGTLTADTVTIDIDNASSYIRQGLALPANTAFVFSIWVLKGTAPGVTPSVRDNASGVVITSVAPILVAGVWQLVSLAFTTTAASTYNFWIGRNGVGSTSLWGASLLPADQSALPYQRVNTSTDYDADPTKFPLYLSANGTNTWMQINSIDFTATDKVTVFAGVRKLVDSDGQILETSATQDTNPGTIQIRASLSSGATYLFGTRGSANASLAVTGSVYAAPLSSVLSATGDISGDSAILRVNGVLAATSGADQGTGNYGNYPLYLFRRAGTSLPFNGNFYGLLIRGALTSDPQIIAMERWLAPKTGVTLP